MRAHSRASDAPVEGPGVCHSSPRDFFRMGAETSSVENSSAPFARGRFARWEGQTEGSSEICVVYVSLTMLPGWCEALGGTFASRGDAHDCRHPQSEGRG